MNLYIKGKNAEGKDVNSDGEQVIDCKENCGRKTTMLGTRMCDFCWERERRERRGEQGMLAGEARVVAEGG